TNTHRSAASRTVFRRARVHAGTAAPSEGARVRPSSAARNDATSRAQRARCALTRGWYDAAPPSAVGIRADLCDPVEQRGQARFVSTGDATNAVQLLARRVGEGVRANPPERVDPILGVLGQLTTPRSTRVQIRARALGHRGPRVRPRFERVGTRLDPFVEFVHELADPMARIHAR